MDEIDKTDILPINLHPVTYNDNVFRMFFKNQKLKNPLIYSQYIFRD